MAFNFLGTLSIPQLQELRNFLESQLVDIDEELNYLRVEMNGLNKTLTDFSEVDNIIGGGIFSDVKHTSANWIMDSEYVTKISDVRNVPKQDDRVPAEVMSEIKAPFTSTIKFKRERIEYKIKKLIDAIEQTKEMIDTKAIAKSQTKALLSQVDRMFNDTTNSTFLFKDDKTKENFLQGIPQ